MKSRYILLIVLLCTAVCSACKDAYKPSTKPDDTHRTLRRACEYLWKQQQPDGSWRSKNYAVVRSGQAYTPFVLEALLEIPDSICPRPSGGVERALDFIARSADSIGRIGTADPDILEYPNYATAYGLRCLCRMNREKDRELIGKMRAYLLTQQFTEPRGFDTLSPAYGGWGFGSLTVEKGQTGHTDVAHVRRILQALREAGNVSPQVFSNALLFLRYLQRHPTETREQPDIPMEKPHSTRVVYDGGFYYSPIVLGANKGEHEHGNEKHDAYFRSYATATCDGVLALLAAGIPLNDEKVVSARKWLEAHPALDHPEGIPEGGEDAWHLALHYYHLMVRAEAYNALQIGGNWRAQIAAILTKEQNADGSFTNKSSVLMKEDDPLLATSFAVTALGKVF